MTQLTEALAALEVLESGQHETLRVYGLRWQDSTNGPLYCTLDEALQSDQFEVTEVDRSGQVPQLKVVNRGDTMVLIMAGEELVGAKQNRVLNASIMIKPSSEQPIPVSCVESGRWSYRSAKFTSSGTTSHSSLRSLMSQQVIKSYRDIGRPTSDQAAVWDEVSKKLERMESVSSSSELHQVYRDREQSLDSAVQRLTPPDGCSGAVFAAGDRILGLDLFDKPDTLVKLWSKLLRGYVIDALEGGVSNAQVSKDNVQAWLASLASAKSETFKSSGVGDDVRLDSGRAHGAALVVESSPVHVELFPAATLRS